MASIDASSHERYDDIVAFSELERFVDQKLKNFSSGMQVRLAYAIAIQVDFDILLLDEVLAVGDESFQQKCFETFARFREERKTIVFVTHGLGLIETIRRSGAAAARRARTSSWITRRRHRPVPRRARTNRGRDQCAGVRGRVVTHRASLGDFVSKASFWKPDYVSSSAWLEHAPFAFWLVDTIRPTVFVELGTHTGFSYLSLCQAVARLELTSKGFAVDTWKGDEQTGFYGDEVFAELAAYHGLHYSTFSRLVRSSFDEAVESFEDGSIDLLHIDGFHGYDAVRHDFDTWRPKLSPRGVVLFHDTNVHESGFGVNRLWEELRRDHAGFECAHGHGLGVLGVGTELSRPIRKLFETEASPTLAAQVRSAYAQLGRAVRLEFELGEAQEIFEHGRREATEKLAARDDAIAALEETLAARGAELRDSRTVEATVAKLEDILVERSAEAVTQRARAEQHEHQMSTVLSSKSWRVTAPLRYVGRHSRAATLETTAAAHGLLLRLARSLVPARTQRYIRRRFPAAVDTLMNPAMVRSRDAHAISAPGRRFEIQGAYSDTIQARYEAWRDRHEPDAVDLQRQRQDARDLAAQPLVSIVVPVLDPPADILRATVESVLQQTYAHLELCLANAGSNLACAALISEFVRQDPRVRCATLGENRGISANSNAALELATGDFVALLDHDDLLAPDALYRIVGGAGRGSRG